MRISKLSPLSAALGMLEVVTVDVNRSPFPNPSDIVVGRASDVVVTVRCVATPVRIVVWRYTGNNSLVPMGLQPFGASQHDGVLRIYPADLLGQVNQYTCSGEGTAPLPVQFRLGEDGYHYKMRPFNSKHIHRRNCAPPTISFPARRQNSIVTKDITSVG